MVHFPMKTEIASVHAENVTFTVSFLFSCVPCNFLFFFLFCSVFKPIVLFHRPGLFYLVCIVLNVCLFVCIFGLLLTLCSALQQMYQLMKHCVFLFKVVEGVGELCLLFRSLCNHCE